MRMIGSQGMRPSEPLFRLCWPTLLCSCALSGVAIISECTFAVRLTIRLLLLCCVPSLGCLRFVQELLLRLGHPLLVGECLCLGRNSRGWCIVGDWCSGPRVGLLLRLWRFVEWLKCVICRSSYVASRCQNRWKFLKCCFNWACFKSSIPRWLNHPYSGLCEPFL